MKKMNRFRDFAGGCIVGIMIVYIIAQWDKVPPLQIMFSLLLILVVLVWFFLVIGEE